MRGATTPLTNNAAAYDIREVEMGFDLGTDTRVVYADTRWGTAAVMRGATTPLTENAAAYDIREVEMGFDLGTDTRGAQADTRWGTAAVRRGVTMPLTNNVAAYDIRWLTAVARYMRAKTPLRQHSRCAASGRGGSRLAGNRRRRYIAERQAANKFTGGDENAAAGVRKRCRIRTPAKNAALAEYPEENRRARPFL